MLATASDFHGPVGGERDDEVRRLSRTRARSSLCALTRCGGTDATASATGAGHATILLAVDLCMSDYLASTSPVAALVRGP